MSTTAAIEAAIVSDAADVRLLQHATGSGYLFLSEAAGSGLT